MKRTTIHIHSALEPHVSQCKWLLIKGTTFGQVLRFNHLQNLIRSVPEFCRKHGDFVKSALKSLVIRMINRVPAKSWWGLDLVGALFGAKILEHPAKSEGCGYGIRTWSESASFILLAGLDNVGPVLANRSMPKTADYVLVYDISNDSDRLRVSKVLEGFGFRVQMSAFECQLTRGAREQLRKQLEDLKLETGFVYLYRREALSKRIGIGKCPDNPFDDSRYAYVI